MHQNFDDFLDNKHFKEYNKNAKVKENKRWIPLYDKVIIGKNGFIGYNFVENAYYYYRDYVIAKPDGNITVYQAIVNEGRDGQL